jgi:hypothetical protein
MATNKQTKNGRPGNVLSGRFSDLADPAGLVRLRVAVVGLARLLVGVVDQLHAAHIAKLFHELLLGRNHFRILLELIL